MKPSASTNSAFPPHNGPQSGSDFDRFKDFARRIAAVQKQEVDALEKALPPLKRGRKAKGANQSE